MIGPITKFLKKVKSIGGIKDSKKKHPLRSPVAPGSEMSQGKVAHTPQAIKSKPKRQPSKSKSGKTRKRKTKPTMSPWSPEDFQVPAMDGKTRFHDLNLSHDVLHAIADAGFQYCTPIQAEILPSTLQGKDATGRAQTGTGKTAAFIITVLSHMLRKPVSSKRRTGTPRVLVLAPTRELVMQIGEEARALAKYTRFKIVNVFGGMDYEKQRRHLTRQKIDIVVATPGRLLDFKRHKDIDLSRVEVMIIDEADRMLDMGFIPDVRKIIYSTPHKSKRQTLLFSATLTPAVGRLAQQWTKSPVTVEIEPEQVAVETVQQLVYIVTNEEKHALLYNIITMQNLERVIVFCNRKDETRRLAEVLRRYRINCAILSGDIRQQTRVRTLSNFKAGKIRVLVATDVAGRGIHIEGMDHVINYTLPRDPEDYVHRIGRTGRAGAIGTSISFADEDDSFSIPAIEELLGKELSCIYPEEEWLTPLPPAPKAKPKSNRGPRKKRVSGRKGTRRHPSHNHASKRSRPPRQRQRPQQKA